MQAIETMEVNKDIRDGARSSMEAALNNLPDACHVLLLVGTKFLASVSRPKVAPLQPRDIFLLNLYAQALFKPHGRCLTEN